MMDYQSFLFRLLLALTNLRLSGDPHGTDCGSFDAVFPLISRGLRDGHISSSETVRLYRLARNALLYSWDSRFPDARNAGPYMPTSVWFQRHDAEVGSIVVKLAAQVTANEEPEPVSAPAAPRSLQLLCLLVPSRTGEQRSLPVHGMPPLPPRRGVTGRWSLGLPAGLSLRETHAAPPSPEVLARCVRQRKAHPVRTHLRTV